MRSLGVVVLAVVIAACGQPARPAAPGGGSSAGSGDADGSGTGSAAGGAGSGSAAGGGSGSAAGGAGALPVVGHNQTCYARDGRDQGTQVAECAEGLQCCYPCGIPGCDSVCHTPEECQEDMTRP